MNIKKLALFLLVIFVLFWVISAPTGASGSVNSVVGNLHSAGTSLATFMQNLLGGGGYRNGDYNDRDYSDGNDSGRQHDSDNHRYRGY